MIIKKIKPMFTKIVTTCNKYEKDELTGGLVTSSKAKGSVKEYQTVISVGTSVRDVQEGDVVVINPTRYAVMKHSDKSLKNGIIGDNMVLGYNLPIIEIDGTPHMLLESQDVEYIVEEYEEDPIVEETLESKAAKAGIYTPGKPIL